MPTNDKLVIEISSKSSSYLDFQTLLKGSGLTDQADPALFFVGHQKILAKNTLCAEYAEYGDYDFVFIRDDMNPCIVEEAVSTLLRATPKNRAVFLVHHSGGKIGITENSIDSCTLEDKFIYQPVSFSHTDSDPIWKPLLCPFFKAIDNEFADYSRLFDQIWTNLADPNVLRSRILTPLVALDLIHQAKLFGNMDNRIMEGIESNLKYIDQANVVPTLIDDLDADESLEDEILKLLDVAKEKQEIDHALLMKVAQRLEELLITRS
jgi:hypothetical protein